MPLPRTISDRAMVRIPVSVHTAPRIDASLERPEAQVGAHVRCALPRDKASANDGATEAPNKTRCATVSETGRAAPRCIRRLDLMTLLR